MDDRLQLTAVGSVRKCEEAIYIQLYEPYFPALTHLQDFSHLQIVWWAHLTDDPRARETLVAENLFKKGPKKLGIFATRAPARPNPLMISTIAVSEMAIAKGRIYTPFIDAEEASPVLDIKPYYPMERVRDVTVPGWCCHWPSWQEEVASFDWQDEINRG
jgi:tRNA (Thr-GGU) A37 N-methylase